MDYTIRIGGEAGQGLQTIGVVIAKVFSRSGFHVFTHQDYMSRVRGGHNFYQIRFSDAQVMSSREKLDILIALDLNTIDIHKKYLNDGGIIMYDADFIKKTFESPEFLHIPLEKIARPNSPKFVPMQIAPRVIDVRFTMIPTCTLSILF